MKKVVKVIIIPLISLIALITIGYNVTFGWENPYKFEKQEKRFQDSALRHFKITLDNNFTTLERKASNLEAANQNLQEKVSAISSEKDKLSRAYAQLQAKQSALENEHNSLKRKTASLEVAYKRLEVAYNKLLKEKTQIVKRPVGSASAVTTQKTQTSTRSTTQKTAEKKPSVAEMNKGSVSPEPQAPLQKPTVSPAQVTMVSEEQRRETVRQPERTVSELDITKINERGIEYGKRGMYDEAIKEFQKVAALEPNTPNVYYNLGLAYRKKGMKAEAEKAFAEYERLKGHLN
ncbi:MAG: tetratricopeptide repeat protein [Candidatus Loosdrechtia sp.]|uniref:tetratricopeptide repeat protein n=1 Tax=Candidatus Loosdrechtia sp. TaxID=3101272 RepID=UPI003A6ADF57|nr:MAG: tetratricopeptide repeat protein [Candidatus Jettenia sp. AMX2]